jgi:ribosomal protein S18 acetylase RimI-like enzyme
MAQLNQESSNSANEKSNGPPDASQIQPYLTPADLQGVLVHGNLHLPSNFQPSRLRLATKEDAPQLVSLINLAYEDAHWFKQPHFHNRVSLPGILDTLQPPLSASHSYIILESPSSDVNQPCGLILSSCFLLHRDEPTGQVVLSQLSVHPQFHRQGLAKGHMKIAAELAKSVLRAKELYVEVVSLQPHLLEIYGRMGMHD